jgi:2-keto-4-pentenoate hydratase
MDLSNTAAVAEAFAEARLTARPLEPLRDWGALDLAGAYRLQAALVERLGPVRGWKISAVTPAQQKGLGLSGPIAGPLLAPWFKSSGSRFERAAFCAAPLLECEYAFEIAKDLPPRATPYTRAEVEAAIGGVHVVLEICDSRLTAPMTPLQALVDCFNNGGFVLGPKTADWRSVDYAGAPIALRKEGDGEPLATGNGKAVLDGDPVGTVVMMANLQPPVPGGLKAGDVVTTGSCNQPYAVNEDGEYIGDFGPLGSVRVVFGAGACA